MTSPTSLQRLSTLFAALTAAAALSACGGSSDTTANEDAAAVADASEVKLTEGYRRARTAPTFVIATPTTTAVYSTTSSTVNMGGTVKDSAYVSSVTWKSDRGPSGTAVLTGTQPLMTWAAKGVPLSTNLNNVTLTATNSAGKSSILAVAVTLTVAAAPPPAPAPAPAPVPVATGSGTGGTATVTYNSTQLMKIPAIGAYPAKGSTIIDPVTGFNVTRVADKSELTGDYGGARSGLSAIVYSRFSPTNTTGEFVVVHGENSTSAWIYRTSNNAPVTILRFKPSLGTSSRSLGEVNELRWDYTGQHPYRLYFTGRSLPGSQRVGTENVGMTFYYVEFDPVTGVQSNPVVIRDFTADFPGFTNGEIMNDVEGDSSNDSRYWAWQVMNTSLSSGYQPYAVFAYDKTNNVILGRMQRSCAGAPTPCAAVNTPAAVAPYISRPNMVEMSPLGTRVIVHFNRPYAGNFAADAGSVADGPKAFLPNFTDPIRIGADSTHSGWAWGVNGEELFVSQNNRNDWIEAVNIANATTANCKLISGNSWGCGTKVITMPDLDGGSYTIGYHFGKIYDRSRRGWIYMNTYDSTGYSFWGKNQNLLVQVNDASGGTKSKVVRLGSTYNTFYDYRSEGSGALDFKGENIWTTGNWGYTDGRGDVFRIQLPAGFLTSLP